MRSDPLGLGQIFRAAVRDGTQAIIEDPERFAQPNDACRYLQLARFPYIILFAVTANELLILAVFHAARSPQSWQERV